MSRREHATQQKKQNTNGRNYLNQYYQYSSEAYELEPEHEEYEIQRVPIRKRKPKKVSYKERQKKIKKRNAPRYVYENLQERKISFTALLTFGLIFAGILSYLTIFGMTAVAQNEIQTMNNELKETKEYNQTIKNVVIDRMELENIKTFAMTKLGMVVPEEHQKVYIDVPKQNYFIKNDIEILEPESIFSLGSLLSFISGE